MKQSLAYFWEKYRVNPTGAIPYGKWQLNSLAKRRHRNFHLRQLGFNENTKA
jgi:hypothetical protein